MKRVILCFSLFITVSCGKVEVSGETYDEVTTGNNSSKKGIWGSEELKGKKITGYSCIKSYSFFVAACASQSKYECKNQLNDIKCGTDCNYDYAKMKIVCAEEDHNAQYIK